MYNDLVPMNLQDELIAIRDSSTRQSWRVADICQEVIDFNRINNRIVEVQNIYAAVGMFVGRASRTVREYHAIGRFFAPEIREQFEVLAFDHFRHAFTLGGELAILALQWCVNQVDALGRPATVDAMMAKFAIPEPGEPEQPEEMDDGPAGIFSQMFRMASTQVMTCENWLASEQYRDDLTPDLVLAIREYKEVAQRLLQAIPVMN